MELSERQRRILQFIRQFTHENRYPPTIREIGEAVGISSTSVVNYNLKSLEEKGLIDRDRTISRGIRLVKSLEEQVVSIPLLGRIAAGSPLPVPDSSSDFRVFGDETIELTRGILKDTDNVYALQVKGDSMIDALIHDGDIVVMKHQQHAENGDLVAVWLREEKETTLKRFYLEGDQVRLQPANPTMGPMYFPAKDVEIQGKVVCVIRQLN
ncbi:MAG: transcriptional repressor LexA [Anaerolineae bacterium]|jgi:repressor LexA|nr:transcriptional repressor LexA [Anaerolineae bacterium]MDH7474221.1 transcriptional repressor LexA [Anaerolineae bacterium]